MSTPDPFRVVAVEFEAADAELAAEALQHYAASGAEAADRQRQLGEQDAAETTELTVRALRRAARAIRDALDA